MFLRRGYSLKKEFSERDLYSAFFHGLKSWSKEDFAIWVAELRNEKGDCKK